MRVTWGTGWGVAAVLLAGASVVHAEPIPFLCGDADGNRVVTVSDGVQVLRAAADMPGACRLEPDACDLDGDGAPSVSDGVDALRLAAGLATDTSCRRPLPGDESLARAEVRLAGCERVTREAQYCLTLAAHLDYRGTTLAVLGLESGELCDVQTLAFESGPWDVSSLGWRGEVVYACMGGIVIRVSTRDGTWESVPVPCEAASADEDGVLVMRSRSVFDPQNVSAYTGYDPLLADTPRATFALTSSTRVAVSRDRLFGAWHSTGRIDVVDRMTGAPLAPIVLERYDDWVNGLAVTDDGDLVISRWGAEVSTITVFDAATGARKREFTAPALANGLACTTQERSFR